MATVQQRAYARIGLSRLSGVVLAIWLVAGLGLYAFQNEILFALWLFALPMFLVHFLFGVTLLFAWGSRVLTDHWFPAWPAGALVSAQFVFIFGSPQLTHVAALARLIVERPTMEAIIANASEARRLDPQRRQLLDGDWDGVRYAYDFGPPVRVAFEWYNGIGDWSGVVWDPTGVVMQAKGCDTPRPVIRLFGGVLVRCRPLWGPYYRCDFT